MKITPFFAGLLAFCIGVFCADFFREYWVLVLNFLFLGFLFFSFRKKLLITLFSCIGFLCGALFFLYSFPDTNEIETFVLAEQEKTVEIEGFIDSFPRQKTDEVQLYITVVSIKNDDEWIDISQNPERILFRKYGIHEFSYGEKIKIWGKLERPGSWEKFSYDRFLEKERVYALVKNGSIKRIDSFLYSQYERNEYENTWIELWKTMFGMRTWFETQVRYRLAFPENEYALGIVLGAESGIPEKIIEEFNDTGLRHLLALSGMNITILIIFIGWVLFFLPVWLRIACTAVVIFLFVGLTGGSSSVVRAAIMGVIGLFALHSGRKLNPLYLLILALVCMTLYNPFLLLSDVSLQFSALAVLGMLYIVPMFEKSFSLEKYMPKDLALVLYATLAAQIATLPLMLVFFEAFSLVSPLANLLVVPITTASMFLSFLVSVPVLGWVVVPFAYMLLHFSLGVATAFSKIPFAVIETSQFAIWTLLPFYTVIILFLFWWKLLLQKREA